MNPELAILLSLLVPLAGAGMIALAHSQPNLRETVTMITAGLLFLIVLSLLPDVLAGGRPSLHLVSVLPGLELAFRVEPLGMLFGLIASGLWIVNSLYSIGYMRGNNEPRQTSFYICFAVAIASTLGIAFSGNLFTLFVFYEGLTLSTYPLVVHKGTDEAKRAGRTYLGVLLGSSILLFLTAIIWTWYLAGSLDFLPGGLLAGKVEPGATLILLILFVYGIGKAAVMPLHRWLPAAMVAPTPVSALLHAVAVVKAGVFTVLKVVVYVFGIEQLAATSAHDWLVYLACFSLLAASVIAWTRSNLKARLAYSTVSQLAYVVLGAALATNTAAVGAGLHIATHAVGKITLFFCAGAIYVATHKTEVEELDGLGRSMPITMAAFLIGSLSVIGIPPFAGAWSKWYLALGALDAGQIFVVAVLMLSSLLNVAYLLPIAGRAFFVEPPKGEGHGHGIKEAPLFCLVPLCLTAAACLLLTLFVDDIVALLEPMLTGG